ncbi:SpoIIE family protein phosphatase [Streptomyces sp. LP05-1]|uniref:SpoIIE family protein phosphatase n=1 Tax=Streptomyces pyxinae TaxID=2970734 RepID=A0ABT2CBZ3_9ACTN|nr:SpoIIE family protein phosphatase [Streptomyces sp. LP05-1]MCS0634896.1 SpoIIE family protein phosphatase [Streptomyces sp. LP05-1]
MLPEPTTVSSIWGHDVSILLVEDDAGDALLFEEVLADSDLNAELTWCKTLTEAEALLRNRSQGVCVLLDLHLPDAQGLVAVRRALTCAPDAAIVVLTGLAESRSGLAAVAEGAQDYLSKGQLTAEGLSRAVRYALQRKQVQQANDALKASRLRAQENARLERGLLPVPLLRRPGFSVVARYEPGRAHGILGGDFYDVVQTEDGAVHAVIGDVSGHGPAEAALGVCLRVAWRAAVLSGRTGADQLRLLEEILVAERGGDHLFATLTSCVFAPDRSSVRVVRAGHPGLLLHSRDDGRVTWYDPPGGMALGFLPGVARWPETELPIMPDTSVVAFTDGLFEGRVGPGRRLGEEGLLEIARNHAGLPGQEFVDRMVDEVAAGAAPFGGLSDDIAVIHLNWNGEQES